MKCESWTVDLDGNQDSPTYRMFVLLDGDGGCLMANDTIEGLLQSAEEYADETGWAFAEASDAHNDAKDARDAVQQFERDKVREKARVDDLLKNRDF